MGETILQWNDKDIEHYHAPVSHTYLLRDCQEDIMPLAEFFRDIAYTLSLHDALPIYCHTPCMVMLDIFIVPFQYCFTQ